MLRPDILNVALYVIFLLAAAVFIASSVLSRIWQVYISAKSESGRLLFKFGIRRVTVLGYKARWMGSGVGVL